MTDKRVFTARVDAFARARCGLANAERRYALASRAVVAGLFALLVLSGWLPNAFVNVALFAAVAVFLLSLPILYAKRTESPRGHVHEAFCMEELAGGLNSRVVSALDFLEQAEPSSLMQVVIDQAEGDLALDFEARMDYEPRNKARVRFFGLLAAFIILGLTPLFGFRKIADNILASFMAVRERLFPVVYEVMPPYGKHVFLVGKEVDVSIRFTGRGYREVTLIRTVYDEAKEIPLKVDATGRASTVVKGDEEAEHHLRFRMGERTTDEIVLIFTEPPVLENMQTELVYPPYTRILPKDLEGLQDRIYCLAGSRITFGFTFSKELASASFVWDNGEELPLEVMGRFASTTLIHSEPREATLQAEDIHGFALRHPLRIAFEVQVDEKPQVFLPSSLKPEMPTLAEGLKLFGFGARLRDDYGVSRCVLKWTKSTISNPSRATQKGEEERQIVPPRRKVIVSFQKIFESVAVQPGDRISFKVEVYDNRQPNSQMAASPARALFVYQKGLDDLSMATLGFNVGKFGRSRIAKSKRATSVKAPMATRTKEKVWNEFEARIDTAAKPPRIPGRYAQPVKDYFRLLSTARRKSEQTDDEDAETPITPRQDDQEGQE